MAHILLCHCFRAYDTKRQDATGVSVNLRGYSDPNLFSAQVRLNPIPLRSKVIMALCKQHKSRTAWK
ncbi:hypothetical protein DPMN_032758 [Dreissena polymorpha]|uniref:Uncharacterized protein n=1 Tax=Dreissena polymorpha TaxID=45954 RepID=A0A9D4M5C1_DREPO|nr:hypothetical protein DPMN_032758 [Dreissena polymorpha]